MQQEVPDAAGPSTLLLQYRTCQCIAVVALHAVAQAKPCTSVAGLCTKPDKVLI